MQKFNIEPTTLDELIVVEPSELGQGRDFLFDLSDQTSYKEMGLEVEFVEHNVERYARGVLRGLHFQPNRPMGKFVAVTRGAIYDVVVNLHPLSKMYGAAYAVELNAESERMLYVPPYFAHGFVTLEPQTEVVYNCTEHHDSQLESGIIWDDQILAIDWPFDRYDIDEKYLAVNQRDRKRTAFRRFNQNTIWSVMPPKKQK